MLFGENSYIVEQNTRVSPEKEKPFNPVRWGGIIARGYIQAQKDKNVELQDKYMKINNLYSICLMICMNHEMNYGNYLFLFESYPTTKEWKYYYD